MHIGQVRVHRGFRYTCVQGAKRLVWKNIGAITKSPKPTEKWAIAGSRKSARQQKIAESIDTKVSNRFAPLADDEEDQGDSLFPIDPYFSADRVREKKEENQRDFLSAWRGEIEPTYDKHRNWWYYSDPLSLACVDVRTPKRKRANFRRWWRYRAQRPANEQWRVTNYLFPCTMRTQGGDVREVDMPDQWQKISELAEQRRSVHPSSTVGLISESDMDALVADDEDEFENIGGSGLMQALTQFSNLFPEGSAKYIRFFMKFYTSLGILSNVDGVVDFALKLQVCCDSLYEGNSAGAVVDLVKQLTSRMEVQSGGSESSFRSVARWCSMAWEQANEKINCPMVDATVDVLSALVFMGILQDNKLDLFHSLGYRDYSERIKKNFTSGYDVAEVLIKFVSSAFECVADYYEDGIIDFTGWLAGSKKKLHVTYAHLVAEQTDAKLGLFEKKTDTHFGSRVTYDGALNKSIDELTRLTHRKRGPEQMAYMRMLEVLLSIKEDHSTHAVSAACRVKPFTISVYGTTSSMKSAVCGACWKAVALANGIDTSPTNVCTVNFKDQYFSEVTSQQVLILDDFMNERPETLKGSGINPIRVLLDWSSQNAVQLPAAAIKDKGERFCNAQILMLTHHMQTFNAAALSMQPEAAYRRVEVYIEVTLRPEYRDNMGQPDSSKIPSVGFPDVWTFNVYKFKVVGTDGTFVKVQENIDNCDLMAYLSLESRQHFEFQRKNVKLRNDPDTFFCEHNNINGACHTCRDVARAEADEFVGLVELFEEVVPEFMQPGMDVQSGEEKIIDTKEGRTIYSTKLVDVREPRFVDVLWLRRYAQILRSKKPFGMYNPLFYFWFVAKMFFIISPMVAAALSIRAIAAEWEEWRGTPPWMYPIKAFQKIQRFIGRLETVRRVAIGISPGHNLQRAIENSKLFKKGWVRKRVISLYKVLPKRLTQWAVNEEVDSVHGPVFDKSTWDLMTFGYSGVAKAIIDVAAVLAASRLLLFVYRLYKRADISRPLLVEQKHVEKVGKPFQIFQGPGEKDVRIVFTEDEVQERIKMAVEASDAKYIEKLEGEAKSMWSKVVLPSSVLDHRARTTSHGTLERKIEKALFRAVLSYTKVEDGMVHIKSTDTHVLFVRGQDALMPTHCFPLECTEFTLFGPFGRVEDVGNHVLARFDRANMINIPDTDYTLVRLPAAIPRANLVKYFPLVSGPALCKLMTVVESEVKDVGQRYLRDYVTAHLSHGGSDYCTMRVYKATYPVETYAGMCGSVWIGNPRGQAFIHSLHIAGDGVMGGAVPILQRALVEAGDALDLTGSMRVHSSSLPILSDKFSSHEWVGEHHFLRFLPAIESPAILDIVGTHDRPLITVRQDIRPSPIARALCDELEWEPAHGKVPQPNHVKHYQHAMEEIIHPRNLFFPGILDLACADYLDHIKNQLGASLGDLSERVHPLPDDVVVSGQNGVIGVDSMTPSTSAGFPERGPKRRFYVPCEGVDEDLISIPMTLDEEHLSEVNECEERLASGERAFLPISMSVKVEPTKVTKEYARIFGCCNLTLTFLFRRYYLTIFRLIYLTPLSFEMAVGLNVHGTDWDALANYLEHKTRIVAGDYQTYDKVMSSDLILRAFGVLIELAKDAGYTERQLTIMRGIATEIAFPMYEGKGVLFVAGGSNPSGHPGTTIINCIVNSFYMRYCYYMKAPEKGLRFADHVKLATMGDDHIASVAPDCTWFDCYTIQEVLAGAELTYTTATKSKEFTAPFENLTDTSFVSRGFRWCDFMNRWVAPLAEKSLKKSYLCQQFDKGSPYDPSTLAFIVAEQNDVELFFHGKEYYDRVALAVRNAFIKSDLSPPELKPWEHWKEVLNGAHEEELVELETQAHEYDSDCDEYDCCKCKDHYSESSNNILEYTMRLYGDGAMIVSENWATGIRYNVNVMDLTWHYFDFSLDRLFDGTPVFRSGVSNAFSVHPSVFYALVEMTREILVGYDITYYHGFICLGKEAIPADPLAVYDLDMCHATTKLVPASLHNQLWMLFGGWKGPLPTRHNRWIGDSELSSAANSRWNQVVTVSMITVSEYMERRTGFISDTDSDTDTQPIELSHSFDADIRLATMSNNDAEMGVEHTIRHNMTSSSNWTSVRPMGSDQERQVIRSGQEVLSNYISRPVIISQEEWGIGITYYKSFRALTNVFTTVRPKLAHFTFAKFKLVIDIEVSGNPFLYGMLLVNWVPYDKYDYLLRDRGVIPQDNIEASQRQRLFIDASTSAGGRMEIPFYWPNDAFHIVYDNPDDFGYLSIRTLNNLSHVTGGQQTVNFTIRAHLEDLEVYGNTWSDAYVPNMQVQSSEMPDERLSSMATRIAKIAHAVSPVIGPYAIATEKAASAAAMGLRAMGLSHPRSNEPVSRLENTPLGNKSNFNSGANAFTLALDKMNEVSPSPVHVGLSEDEMSFDYITQKETYIRTLSWGIADKPDTVLSSMRVSPTFYDTANSVEYHLVPMFYLARLFSYWTGSIKVRIQVVCSAFHRGKLRIFHDPCTSGGDGTTWTTNNNVLLDISEEREVTIEIPYMQARQWSQVLGFNNGTGFLDLNSNNQGALTDTNGALNILVMNKLVTPDPTVVAPAYINLYVSAGKDFKLAAPTLRTVFNPYQTIPVAPTQTVAGKDLGLISGWTGAPNLGGAEPVVIQGMQFKVEPYSPVTGTINIALKIKATVTGTPAPIVVTVGTVDVSFPLTTTTPEMEVSTPVSALSGLVPLTFTMKTIPAGYAGVTIRGITLPVPPGTKWKSAVGPGNVWTYDGIVDMGVLPPPGGNGLRTGPGAPSLLWDVGGSSGLYTGGGPNTRVVFTTFGDFYDTKNGLCGTRNGIYNPFVQTWGPGQAAYSVTPLGLGNYQNTTMNWGKASGSDIVLLNAVFLTAQSGNEIDMGNAETDPSPAMPDVMIHDAASNEMVGFIYHGEQISHLRQIFGRPNFYRGYTAVSTPTKGVFVVQIGDSDFPNPPNAGDFSLGNDRKLTILNYMAACYNSWRGTIRSDYIIPNVDQVNHLVVVRNPSEVINVGVSTQETNANDAVNSYATLNGTGWTGAVITNPKLSNHLHTEFPYYYRYRFNSARPKSFQQSLRASNTHLVSVFCNKELDVTKFAVLRYIQTGEDFSLFNWMGTPVLFDPSA
nr:MAG: hypothetical protein [Picornaviridae sp.]